jgi:hypothetical protein
MLAAMCALGLLGMVIENATIRHAGKAVANFVLVATEFSYPQCGNIRILSRAYQFEEP